MPGRQSLLLSILLRHVWTFAGISTRPARAILLQVARALPGGLVDPLPFGTREALPPAADKGACFLRRSANALFGVRRLAGTGCSATAALVASAIKPARILIATSIQRLTY